MEQDNRGSSARIFDYGALLVVSAVIIMRPLFSGVSAPFFSNMIVVLLIYAAFALWVFEGSIHETFARFSPEVILSDDAAPALIITRVELCWFDFIECDARVDVFKIIF